MTLAGSWGTNYREPNIARYEGHEIAEIGSLMDLDELLKKVKQIDALKVALESCDQFRENAIRYAKLEAAALIRVVELGGETRLKGYKKKVAEWLHDLSDGEREKYIAMCEAGLTIDQVWKQEVHDGEKLQDSLKKIYYLRENYVDTAKEEGLVDISSFAKEARSVLPSNIASDVVDGIRKSLRNAGAVGIGGDTGLYIMPTPEHADKVKEAILQRFDSAVADFAKIAEIAKAAKLQLSYEDFGVDIYAAERSSKGYLCHFLIALDRLGVLSNSEKMWDDLARSQCYADIAFVEKMGVAHGVEAAEMVLNSYKKKQAEANEA